MRILAIGDFHGKVPRNLKNFVKKNKIDLILCTGDICSSDRIEWRYWKRLEAGERLIDILGKRKMKKLIMNELKKSKNVLKFLDQIKIPLILVYGNGDITNEYLRYYGIKSKGIDDLIKQNKNMKLLSCGKARFNNIVILGHSGYRGYMTKKDKFRKFSKKINKINLNWKKELKKLTKHVKGDFIFLTHDVPFGKLDKVKNKKSPAYGERLGDEFYLNFDKKYKPVIHVCGHMHENQGKTKIGKTIIVNSGYGRVGEAALINLPKLKVKFVKI